MKAQAWWSISDEHRIRVLFADQSLATYFVSGGVFKSRSCLREAFKDPFLEFIAGALFYSPQVDGGRYDLHLPIVLFTIPDTLHAHISSCAAVAFERNNELCSKSSESDLPQELAMREHEEQKLYYALEELHAYMMQALLALGKTLHRSASPVPEEYKRRQDVLYETLCEKLRPR